MTKPGSISSINDTPEKIPAASEPDAITGMIFALEGIRDTIVLLNGPMGCRFYHSTTSQFLSIHPLLYLPDQKGERIPVDYNYLNNWFFRQQRVPCTWLDGYDYVYGTAEKVREAILYIREHISFELLCIVNAPGASLIGDMLSDLADELLKDKAHLVLESPGFSTSFADGFSQAGLQLLQNIRKLRRMEEPEGAVKDRETKGAEKIKPEDGQVSEVETETEAKIGPSVNVLGLSLWNRYFEGDREEIRRILSLCGIHAGTFLCADCSLAEIRNMKNAQLNLVLDPEAGLAAAKYLQEEYGTPYYCCQSLPIGFDAAEKLCKDLCALLHTDDSSFLEESRRSRAYAYYKLNGIYQQSGLPKGARFAVEGSPSQVSAYSAFLTSYLGMRRVKAEEAELVFSDANRIAQLLAMHKTFCGIEINYPGMGYTDLTRKTHLGVQGALFLIEQVINGLMSRL